MSVRHSILSRTNPPVRRRAGVLTWITKRLALFSERRRLSDLPDHILDDIGVSRRDAEREAKRDIWDVPSHWKL